MARKKHPDNDFNVKYGYNSLTEYTHTKALSEEMVKPTSTVYIENSGSLTDGRGFVTVRIIYNNG